MSIGNFHFAQRQRVYLEGEGGGMDVLGITQQHTKLSRVKYEVRMLACGHTEDLSHAVIKGHRVHTIRPRLCTTCRALRASRKAAEKSGKNLTSSTALRANEDAFALMNKAVTR